MSDPKEAAVFAFLVTALLSIPAASQEVDITSEDPLAGEIQSKFSDHFEVEFDPGKVFMKEISSESKFEMNKSYREKTTVFQTPRGYIEKTVSNDSIIKTVHTPFGTFKSGVEDGENISSFEGDKRNQAERIKEELEDEMSERAEKVEEKKRLVMGRMLPDIELEVEEEHEVEHFNLTNKEDDEIDLSGWRVLSQGTNQDTLSLDRKISSGETLTFYSGDREEVKGIEDAVYDTGLTIYSDSGELTLFNEHDKAVDTFEY